MDNLVDEIVKNCYTCQMNDKSGMTRKGPLNPVPFPSKPWEKLGLDIVGPDMSVPENCRYAITMIDYYSKWPEVGFVTRVTSNTVIEFLCSVFSREGYPREIVTDHGVQFTSHEFEEFLRKRDIKHSFSAIYHPQANGAVERFNRVLKETLQNAHLQGENIQHAIREMLCIYRCTPHMTTGEEPSILLHGRHLRTRLDIVGATQVPKENSDDILCKRVESSQKKMKSYHDNRNATKSVNFKPGALVRVKKPGHVPKGSSKFMGPFKIQKKVGPNTYRLDNGLTWNGERLSRFYGTVTPELGEEHDIFEIPVEDISGSKEITQSSNSSQPITQPVVSNNRPLRQRRQPVWAKDYVMYSQTVRT